MLLVFIAINNHIGNLFNVFIALRRLQNDYQPYISFCNWLFNNNYNNNISIIVLHTKTIWNVAINPMANCDFNGRDDNNRMYPDGDGR